MAAAVAAHPGVVELGAGSMGLVATRLPHRRIVGVRLSHPRAPIVLGVVLREGRPLPEVAAQLRDLTRSIAGDVLVNVEVTGVASTVDS
ncbi:hypothetical protein JHE00_31015 [Prauserella sp. ASG 168]|uniref:Asp23/Gls24 family envelope stress response protein n=1 Tax=Prauserella cavernicola TaxID=2800127 RepID=A0A934QV19_9PSEU|nr:hypothetical protein [Prauserella cavernicola]